MSIHKWTLTGLGFVLGVGAVLLGGRMQDTGTVEAQEEVALYNSRYIYIGDLKNPGIFDTATGVVRMWDEYPENLVRTYTFDDHKDVIVDTISYK